MNKIKSEIKKLDIVINDANQSTFSSWIKYLDKMILEEIMRFDGKCNGNKDNAYQMISEIAAKINFKITEQLQKHYENDFLVQMKFLFNGSIIYDGFYYKYCGYRFIL